MIEPLAKGEPYPGRLPPLSTQWLRIRRGVRYVMVGVPLLVVVVFFVVDAAVGAVAAVMVVGVGAASAVYVKNRTDRHNAAIDRGDIRVAADPHLRRMSPSDLDAVALGRLAALGYPAADLHQVTRFDGGWIVKRRTRGEAVVVGDDGGVAHFDPGRVDDLIAAVEYRGGRGREPAGP